MPDCDVSSLLEICIRTARSHGIKEKKEIVNAKVEFESELIVLFEI